MMRILIIIGLLLCPQSLSARPNDVFIFDAQDETYVKLRFLTHELVHVEMGRGSPSISEISVTPMIANLPDQYVNIYQNGRSLSSDILSVNVDDHSACISVKDDMRRIYLVKICPDNFQNSWKKLKIESGLKENAYGLGQYFYTPGQSEGDLIGRIWDPGFEGYGNTLAPFNGGANGKLMIPILYVLGEETFNYGLFLDHGFKQYWDFQAHPWEVGTFGDKIRFFVMTGADLKNLRHQYMHLTGHPLVPPREIFGFWLSKFGFRNWQEIDTELSHLNEHKFPIDGVVLDLQWFGGKFYPQGSDVSESRMGTLQFDEINFPNAKDKLFDYKNNRKLKVMVIEESYISKDLPEHEDLATQGYLAHHCENKQPIYLFANPWWGKGGMIDWTNPYASDYWFAIKRLPLIKMGITSHWTDLGEPEMYDKNACYFGMRQLGLYRHPEIHNFYNLKWSESIAKGYKRYAPDSRFFILSRSGTGGSQRYGVGLWSGDIAANMGALIAHFNAQIHTSLSGIDYYGSDVGGFHRRDDVLDGDENELYTWWFANSSLFDIPLRPHVWAIGDRNNVTTPTRIGDLASNRYNLMRRYQLLPYYYSLAHAAYRNGDPIISPMVYEFQTIKELRKMGHQKMLGPYLMAGVVARYGQTHRPIFFPKGEWVELGSGKKIIGQNQYIDGFPVIRMGIKSLPIFLREGGIVPTFDLPNDFGHNIEWLYSSQGNSIPLNILILPSKKATQLLYVDDDGSTTAYQEGNLLKLLVEQKKEISSTTVSLTSNLSQADRQLKRPLSITIFYDAQEQQSIMVNDKPIYRCQTSHSLGCFELFKGYWFKVKLPLLDPQINRVKIMIKN